mmetsp:Transcript_124543/g.360110  ORF Transcript_124543/g.360110 Transcript_124543/m.360110 type:complete len:537 (-) Transcript_124543:1200-2810(-)
MKPSMAVPGGIHTWIVQARRLGLCDSPVTNGSKIDRRRFPHKHIIFLPQDVHVQLAAVDETLTPVDVTEGQALASHASPNARGRETDHLAVLGRTQRLVSGAIDEMVAHNDLQVHQFSGRATRILDLHQRLPADKVALIQLHESVQAGFESIVVLRDILAEQRHALLDAEGVHRHTAPIAQCLIHLVKSPVEPGHIGPWHVQLKAMFADEGHSYRDDFRAVDRQVAPLERFECVPAERDRFVKDLGQDVFSLGPIEEQDRSLRGGVFDAHLLSDLEVLAHPPKVVELVARVAGHIELVLGQPHKGQLRVDLPRWGQKVPEADSADGGNLVGDEPVDERHRARAADAKVRKRPICEACVIDDFLALALHRLHVRRPLEGRQGIFQIHGLGMEPTRILPPMGEAKLRTTTLQLLHDVRLRPVLVHHRPRSGPILVEVGDGVVPTVGLLDLLTGPRRRRPSSIARGVGLDELVRRLTVQHPMHDVPTEARGMRDAVGLSASVPIVRLLVRWADQMIAVGGPTRWPIEHSLDACRGQLRD